MSVVFIALPVSLLLAAAAVAAFVWAVRGEQYDDLESPAVRILEDDPLPPERSDPRFESPPSSGSGVSAP